MKSNRAKNALVPNITAVDLFCGVGGLTRGLEKAGVRVAAGVDVDADCRYPFEANNSAAFLERDVGSLDGKEIAKFFDGGAVSLLAGCAPCQPFSSYSRSGRNRAYDAQWPLVLSFGRLVKQVKPDLITMENVPQLLHHEVFNEFVNSLDGYQTWWSVVECASFGIPQTRKRLVLLASRFGAAGLKLKPTHDVVPTVRQTIGTLDAVLAGNRDEADSLHIAPSLTPINLQRIRASRPGGTWRDWPAKLQASCHRKVSGATYPSVYGRMEWDKPAPTITTQCFGFGNGRFGHPEQDRAITLREAAMLQTFPRNYKFVPPETAVRFNKMGRLIGNAVPVRLGEAIGRTLVEHVKLYSRLG